MNQIFPFSRLQVGIICSVLVTIPFLVTTFPPITDLPQQTGQIRLFCEALQAPSSGPYKIQWLAPNNLSYVVLGGCVYLFGYENGGRIAMMLIAVAWCVAIHLLAAGRNRPVEAAILASVFVFNHLIYWGFYSFALGFPLFVWWYLMTMEDATSEFTWRSALKWASSILLLYLAHVFWFWFAVAWFFIVSFRGFTLQVTMRRGMTFLPALVLFGLWFMDTSPGPYSAPMVWSSGILKRLSLAIDRKLPLCGILSPPIEDIVLLLITSWVVGAMISDPRKIASRTDLWILFLTIIFLIAWMAMPDNYDISILVWTRWLPPMAVFLVLAAPPMRLSKVWKQTIALVVFAAFIATTTFAWVRFEREELSGLSETLDSLPPQSRVIGLDYLKSSPRIAFRPFMQIFSYAYLYKKAQLSFSFADLGRSLVAYKELTLHGWTPMLEWHAERAKDSDLKYFDYAVVGGGAEVHSKLAASSVFLPVTRQGHWRLYKIMQTPPSNHQ